MIDWEKRANIQRLNRQLHEAQDWDKWMYDVPALKFGSSWEVKILPPFGGALVRFLVNNDISTYLDVDGHLGYNAGKPYWEVYNLRGPDGEDIERFGLHETADVNACIQRMLSDNKKRNQP